MDRAELGKAIEVVDGCGGVYVWMEKKLAKL